MYGEKKCITSVCNGIICFLISKYFINDHGCDRTIFPEFQSIFQEVQTIQLVDSFMKLMLKIRDDFNTTYLHVTHDLAAARYISDRIAVMYAGMFLEVGSTDDVVLEPLHPHTQLLRKAAPDPDRLVSEKLGNTGEVPNLITPPKGCPFEPRCNYSMEKCKNIIPPYFEINERKIRCFYMRIKIMSILIL